MRLLWLFFRSDACAAMLFVDTAHHRLVPELVDKYELENYLSLDLLEIYKWHTNIFYLL